jgi:hypothetical protein
MSNGSRLNGRLQWDPKISLGHIVTILVLLTGFISGYAVLGTTVTQNKEDIDELETNLEKNTQAHENYVPRNEFNLIMRELSDIKAEIRELRNQQ